MSHSPDRDCGHCSISEVIQNGRIQADHEKSISYVLVAALASGCTWFLADRLPNSKLERLADVIDRRFIAEADQTAIEDAAADAMVEALGDRWSYYISADAYAAHLERQNNEFVGVGITIQSRQDRKGFDIIAVEPDGPAAEAGICAGDILTQADGTPLGELTITEVKGLIMGEKNTQVMLTLLRGQQTMEVSVTRRVIRSRTAEGQMLDGNIGLVTIKNFYSHSAEETIGEVEKLTEQGAKMLIFDVRNNPGGYVHEMVKLLDYLLPEGPLFRSVSYTGKETVEQSDAACLELPMAVLINGNTYSAAEFFAAALSEYDWAVTVGEQTCGKGYYQTTIELGDGSAVALSTGKYSTPNGVNLAETGGLMPDIPVEPAEGAVTAQTDPQIQAAEKALRE